MVTGEFLKTVKKPEDFIEKTQVKILDQLHAKLVLRCRWSVLKKNEYKDIGEPNIIFCRKGYNSLIPLCIQNDKSCTYFKDNNSDADPGFSDEIDKDLDKRNS